MESLGTTEDETPTKFITSLPEVLSTVQTGKLEFIFSFLPVFFRFGLEENLISVINNLSLLSEKKKLSY